jgi:nucleotide sugar dehydrogenase
MSCIPKVVSGLDDIAPGSLDAIICAYGRVFDTLVPVSSPEAAEMTKLYENSQRMMCIAYANEMADACRSLGINPFEVSTAAATKPFGYLPCHPSLGVGGHCIPVNPYYLFSTSEFPLLKAATRTMASRPAKIAERIVASLAMRKDGRLCSSPTSALIVGLGFKEGQSHLVNSPGIDLALQLQRKGLLVKYADPIVPQKSFPELTRFEDTAWNKKDLQVFDVIVVCFKQCGFNLDILDQLSGVDIQKWFA